MTEHALAGIDRLGGAVCTDATSVSGDVSISGPAAGWPNISLGVTDMLIAAGTS